MYAMAKMDAKCGPLKSGDFGDIDKNGKFGWRKWRKIARGLAIQIGCQKKPLWRVTILAIMAKMAKLAIFAKMAELAKIANLEHSPLGEWRF